MTKKPLAFSYLRFSTPDQMKGDSYRRQTELAEQYAETHGLQLDKNLMLKDEGVSAFKAKNVRQGALGLFLKAIDDGLVPEGSFLLVENLDRVSRANPWDAMPVFQSIINAGVTIVTLQDERTWSRDEIRANPFRIFESVMVMIRANEESEIKARRLKAVWKAKRAAAAIKPLTSQTPAWIILDKENGELKVLEERAAVVRRIYEMTVDGMGQHRIAELLNREATPCFGRAKYWHRSYISKIIDSVAPVGTYIPHEFSYDESGRARRVPLDPIVNYFPRIIDDELNQAAKLLRNGGRAPNVRPGRTITNILAGLARCPLCDGTMTRVSKGPKKGGRPYLVCVAAKTGAGCKYRAEPLPPIEEAIISRRSEFLSNCPTGDAEIDPQLTEIGATIWVLEDQVENLASAIAHTPLPTLLDRLRAVEGDLEEARKKRSALIEQVSTFSVAAFNRAKMQFLDAVSRDEPDKAQANQSLRSLLESITIGYDDGSLMLYWKGGDEARFVYDPTRSFPPISDLE
ncbi:recombinase family protein [Hansschlegelia beijingensis]